MKPIYLDYAATTPVDRRVRRVMEPYLSVRYGNPGSLHRFGQGAMAAVDRSRETIAGLIGGDFREVVFTGSATEANNLALRGVVRQVFANGTAVPQDRPSARSSGEPRPAGSYRRPAGGGTEPTGAPPASSNRPRRWLSGVPVGIIVSAIEHESVLETVKDLERDGGVEIHYLPVDRRGFVDLVALRSAINERVVLVSVMYANNEIGTVQPIAEIARIIKEFRQDQGTADGYPLLHTDAVQAFQYLSCDVKRLGVDLMTLSAHKIYGPKGIGALYVGSRVQGVGSSKKDLNPSGYTLHPIITGGGQEFGLRSGTEHVASIVGFAEAARLVAARQDREARRVAALRRHLWHEIARIAPGTAVNGCEPGDGNSLPNVLNISIPGESSQDLLIKLDLVGVATASGSACAARTTKPSHVLMALGCAPGHIRSSLRLSLGRPTTRAELVTAVRRLKRVLHST